MAVTKLTKEVVKFVDTTPIQQASEILVAQKLASGTASHVDAKKPQPRLFFSCQSARESPTKTPLNFYDRRMNSPCTP